MSAGEVLSSVRDLFQVCLSSPYISACMSPAENMEAQETRTKWNANLTSANINLNAKGSSGQKHKRCLVLTFADFAYVQEGGADSRPTGV